MKTISDERDMIMKFADRDGDDGIQKEELGWFFSVAQSRRVQEIKVDAESREAERRAEKEAEKKKIKRKQMTVALQVETRAVVGYSNNVRK